MADVEVRAAHNVLEACAQTETMDKVVFTSSATAIVWREDRKSIELDLDERHWSDVNLCRKFKVSVRVCNLNINPFIQSLNEILYKIIRLSEKLHNLHNM